LFGVREDAARIAWMAGHKLLGRSRSGRSVLRAHSFRLSGQSAPGGRDV